MNQLKQVGHSFKTSGKDAKTLSARAKRAKMTKTAYIMHKLDLEGKETLK